MIIWPKWNVLHKVSMVFLCGKFMDISTFSSGIYIAEVMFSRQENEPNSLKYIFLSFQKELTMLTVS